MIRKQSKNEFLFKNKKYKMVGVIKNPRRNLTLSFFHLYSIKKTLKFLFVDIDNCLIPFNISTIEEKNDRELLISFTKTNNFLIDKLKNKNVYVEEKDFPKVSFPVEEFLDLTNYKVFNEDGVLLGNVTEHSGNSIQKTIRVEKNNGGYVYIPVVDAFVNKIDDKKKEIILNNYSQILL